MCIHPLCIRLTSDRTISPIIIWPEETLYMLELFSNFLYQISNLIKFRRLPEILLSEIWKTSCGLLPSMTGRLLIALLFPDAMFGHLAYSVPETLLDPHIMLCSLTLRFCLTPTIAWAFSTLLMFF